MSNLKPYIATTLGGVEDPLGAELAELGATEIDVRRRAVAFQADTKTMYRINYQVRTAFRILEPIYEFTIRNGDDLYRKVLDVDWRQYIDVDGTFAVDCNAKSDLFRHSKFPALRTKDAIVDQFRRHYNRRPNVQLEQPDLRIHLHLHGENATLLRDSTDIGLHRRNYRRAGGHAPLNEVLAAGILRHAGYTGDVPFVDFMCGSGTLLLEAAAIATNRASQRLRPDFGFMGWPDADVDAWEEVLAEAKAQERDPGQPIIGSDYDRYALDAAKTNLRTAKLDPYVSLRLRDFTQLPPPPPAPGIVVINPPYDRRIKHDDIDKLYGKIGDVLKQRYTGYTAYVFSANREALKHVGLKPAQRIPMFNGPLEARLNKFELF